MKKFIVKVYSFSTKQNMKLIHTHEIESDNENNALNHVQKAIMSKFFHAPNTGVFYEVEEIKESEFKKWLSSVDSLFNYDHESFLKKCWEASEENTHKKYEKLIGKFRFLLFLDNHITKEKDIKAALQEIIELNKG